MMTKPYKADMVNFQNSLGKTRLMNAAEAGNTALASLFLQDDADVNFVSKNDNTALMFAVFNHRHC
jgi:ankyrin repeat protein